MAERKVAKDGGRDGTPQHRLDRAIRDGSVQEPNAGNGPYHCKICQKQLKNKETIKSHLTTQAHMKKENESTFAAKGAPYTGHNAQARSVDTGQADELNLAIQNGQVTEVDKGGESYHCKVCNKNLTKGRIRRHLSSQTHTNKLPKIVLEHDGRNIGRTSLKHSQSSGDDDDEPDIVEDAFAENVLQERNDVKGKYWCSVCNQHLKIYNKLENHLYSQKHNNKLPLETTPQRINKTSEESSGDDDDEPDIVEDAFAENVLQERNDVEGQYWCRVCNQHLKIYNRLANHLLSQKHNNKLPLETTPQRISKTYEEENSGSSEGEDETDPVNIAFKDGVLVEYKGEDPPYYCNICLQPLKIYGKLSNHLQSKKHKEKATSEQEVLRAVLEGHVIEDCQDRQSSKCLLCSQSFKLRRSLKVHLKSEKHLQRIGEAVVLSATPCARLQSSNNNQPIVKEKMNLIGKTSSAGTPIATMNTSRPVGNETGLLDLNLPDVKDESKDEIEHGNKRLIPKSTHMSNHAQRTPPYGAVISKYSKNVEVICSIEYSAEEEEAVRSGNSSRKVENAPAITEESVPVQKEPLVYFDLETGGLANGEDILQIAAICDDDSFMRYVTPTKFVSPRATEVNKLKNQNGVLVKIVSQKPLQMERLETLPIKEALQEFLRWLDTIGPCYLVGHNVSFDKKHFLHHTRQSGMLPMVQSRVLGFIDTLPLFRRLCPQFKKPGPGHSQPVLVKLLLEEKYDAHDALEDVKTLQKLVKKINATHATLLQHNSPY